jgi:mRNA interferase RelE/StbE
MAYTVEYSKEAARDLVHMPRDIADLVRDKINILAQDPFAPNNNATKLQGREGYRLRLGDWRIIYTVDQKRVVVLVVKIGVRGGIYK